MRIRCSSVRVIGGYVVVSAGLFSVSATLHSQTVLDPSTWYNVTNQNSGSCVDASGWGTSGGTPILQWTCGAQQANQEWQFIPTDSGFYAVFNRNASGSVLDVAGQRTTDGTLVQLWKNWGGYNQQWMPMALGNNLYKLVGRGSNRCLEVASSTIASGIQLRIDDCNGSIAQAFTLSDPSSPTPVSSPPPVNPPAAGQTAAGVPLPAGWGLQISDTFGTDSGKSINSFAKMHARYNEGAYWNVDGNGLVGKNVVINGEQETFVHLEQAIAFSPDHITIQARGQADGSITSGELASVNASRNFCTEATFQTDGTTGTWPAFWMYGNNGNHDLSELDVEIPITPNQGLQDVSMYNHPDMGSYKVQNKYFTTNSMNYHNPDFSSASGPHVYTICYNDAGDGLVSRYLDGQPMYTVVWKWAASLGGTGYGADAQTIFELAVGGSWPGDVSDTANYVANLKLWSINYYGPLAQ